jgi:hypothetical protein
LPDNRELNRMLDDTSRAYLAAIEAGDDATVDHFTHILDVADELERQRRAAVRLADAAHGYAERGVPVFPIQPGGKKPLSAHGFKDATVDHAQIDGWWRQWPDANIGVPTGGTFDVIDIDGLEGVAAMYGGDVPLIDSVTVLGVAFTSRDGGRHLYVPAVPGATNKAALYPGVDYRGAGGYVVAPPSIGTNGRRYQWVRPLTLTVGAVAA